MFYKYLLFVLFLLVVGCDNNQPKVEVGLTDNSVVEEPIEKSALVESVPELNKVETLSDVDGRNDLLDNFWVKLPDGVILIRLNEEGNRGCVIKTKPGKNFSIETILQEKPGLWQSWNSKRYYTQNSAKEIKVYDARRAFLNNYFNGSIPDKFSEAKDYLLSRKVKLSILPVNRKLLDSLLDNCLAGQNLSYVGQDIKVKSKSIDAVK
ncbi:MAG: hypothetical protein AAFW70_02220 [Cyanobacteria bacterium J06635_10]